jgi:hypothetical protein
MAKSKAPSKAAAAKKAATPSKAATATKAAVQKKITIEMTAEQLEAFEKQYAKLNPRKPVELIFTMAKKRTSKLKIAGYSYHGNTCCV